MIDVRILTCSDYAVFRFSVELHTRSSSTSTPFSVYFQTLQNVGHQSPVHDAMIVGQGDSCNTVFVQWSECQATGVDRRR